MYIVIYIGIFLSVFNEFNIVNLVLIFLNINKNVSVIIGYFFF